MDLKLRKIGNSLGLILPKEVITNLHLKNGDHLELIEDKDQITLKAKNEEFSEWAEAYRNANVDFKDALKELAK